MRSRSVLMVYRSMTGGMKQHICSLAKGLTDNGIDVTISGPLINPPAPSPVKVVTLHIPENPLTFAGISSVNNLTHLIRENKYDLVHTHGYVAGIIGRFAALLAGEPLLVHTVHNSHPGFSRAVLYGGAKVEVWLSRYTGKIITVSAHLKDELIKIGIPSEKISTVYNGVCPPAINKTGRQEIRKSLGLSPYNFVIGTVARLIPSKGIDLFIEAMAVAKKINPHIKGVIVGDGPEKFRLQELAENLGISDSIMFLGHRTDVPMLLLAFDLFILSSRQEGFGISILEAQCSGLPVIASASGGIPEIISHGVNGLLFPAGDFYALADRISFLLSSNPQYRHTLAMEGMKRVRENYSCDKMIQSTIVVYKELWRHI